MLYSAQYNEYNGDTPVFKGGVPLSGEHQGFYIGRNAVSGIFGVTKTDNVISAVKVLDYLISDYNLLRNQHTQQKCEFLIILYLIIMKTCTALELME